MKEKMMRKLLVPLVLMMAGAAIAAPDVLADPPTITPAPSSDYTDTTSCAAFHVSVHFTVNGDTAKTFASGTTIITGPLFAEYSANGKSVTLNISGPGRLTVSNGSVLIILHGVGAGPLLTPTGIVLAYTAGPVSVVSTSPLEGVLEHGTVLPNICDALAP
jgi:hypothetical protein